MCGALLASLLPEAMSMLPGVPKYIDKAEYSLISFFAFHIAVFVCLKLDIRFENVFGRLNAPRKKTQIIMVVYPLLVITFVVLCFVMPCFSALFDIEGFSNLIYLFISILPPLVSTVLYFFFGKRTLVIGATTVAKNK